MILQMNQVSYLGASTVRVFKSAGIPTHFQEQSRNYSLCQAALLVWDLGKRRDLLVKGGSGFDPRWPLSITEHIAMKHLGKNKRNARAARRAFPEAMSERCLQYVTWL